MPNAETFPGELIRAGRLPFLQLPQKYRPAAATLPGYRPGDTNAVRLNATE